MTRRRKHPRPRVRNSIQFIPERTCHPLMTKLYSFAYEQEIPYHEWSKGAGIDEESLRNRWRRNRNPSLLKVIAAGQYLGYELVWQKIPSMWPEVPQDPKGPTQDNYFIGSLLEEADD